MSADNNTHTHKDLKLDRIYINLNADSDFRIWRVNSHATIDEEVATIHQYVQAGFFRIISLNASERSCFLVMSTSLTRAELREKGFPFSPKDRTTRDIAAE